MIKNEKKGTVYLVGAGPGDDRLITDWGLDILKKADLVFYDRLVNPSLLSFTKEDAEIVYVGKAPNNHFYTQEEINSRLVNSVKEGKIVIRLKGGDPYVFGRGGEEALELLEAGIDFKVIPGITSVMAAASYAGIPLTHRGLSSSFHVFSGHDMEKLDFENIASLTGTLVFVMGLRNLNTIATKLMEYGVSASKPTAVIHYGTTASQNVNIGSLKTIYSEVKKQGIQSPVLIIIGDVVKLSDRLNWFNEGVLAGSRIMVTRTKEQQFELGNKIAELGGEPFYLPTIKIEGPILNESNKGKFLSLKEYDWIFLTSVNAVKHFFELLRILQIDIRLLVNIKFAIVGPATEEALNERGIYADLVPDINTIEYLMAAFNEKVMKSSKVFIPCSKEANNNSDIILREAGHKVDRATIYAPSLPELRDINLRHFFNSRRVDLLTFTSPSTVKNFITICDRNINSIQKQIPVVCIGPVTAESAKEYGFNVIAVADEYNINGLIAKIIENYTKKTE